MEHQIRTEQGHEIVALKGDIDFAVSQDVRKVLLELVDTGKDVLVDMSDVTYIDSSGIAALIEAFQSARTGAHKFGLVAVSPPAMRVLQLAQLEKVFPIHETVAAGASR